MRKRNWKHQQPTSLQNAFELCAEYALEKKRLSKERIAEKMGQTQVWNIYKWISEARMPANLIPTYEAICGASYVTGYLAASNRKLLIDMPTSRPATSTDLIASQRTFADAMAALANFYQTAENPDEAISELTNVMSDMASHRERVSRTLKPELELFGDDDE